MLDHSDWLQGLWTMPRLITPSDVDMAMDNDGKILFCELSSSQSEWVKMGKGQRLLYRNFIFNSANLAVLCKHSVPTTRKINTRKDFDSFQVMMYSSGNIYPTGFQVTPVFKKEAWEPFVKSWFSDARKCRTTCLEKIQS